jgi:hypothetical protein
MVLLLFDGHGRDELQLVRSVGEPLSAEEFDARIRFSLVLPLLQFQERRLSDMNAVLGRAPAWMSRSSSLPAVGPNNQGAVCKLVNSVPQGKFSNGEPFSLSFTVAEANRAFSGHGVLVAINCRPLVHDCNIP